MKDDDNNILDGDDIEFIEEEEIEVIEKLNEKKSSNNNSSSTSINNSINRNNNQIPKQNINNVPDSSNNKLSTSNNSLNRPNNSNNKSNNIPKKDSISNSKLPANSVVDSNNKSNNIPRKNQTLNSKLPAASKATSGNNSLSDKLSQNAAKNKNVNPNSNNPSTNKLGNKKGQASSAVGSVDGNQENVSESSVSDSIKSSIDKKKEEGKENVEDAKTAGKAAANIAAGNKVEGAIDIAKLAWKNKSKVIKKYVIAVIAGFLAIILIFFAILNPVVENVEKIKDKLGQVVEFSEKTSNLYSGLGFQTTDEAFFEELSDQYTLANGEVDLALVMSALMYTETTNDYTTDFSIDKLDEEDGTISSLISEIKEVIDESTSEYTQGQILRARMLCKGMTEETEGEKVTFDEFTEQYGSMLEVNAKNLNQSFDIKALPGIFLDLGKNIINALEGPTYTTVTGEQVNALSELFDTVTMGAKSIKNISVEKEEVVDENGNTKEEYVVYVTMITKEYSEEKFKNYLASYYIKKMPEFKPLLKNLDGTALDAEVDSIIKEIYDHRDWYVDIYGNIEGATEDYEEACVGAISQEILSELALPVKVTSSSVTFNGEYAYGVTSAKMHNGIDLNADTTGTKEGDSVFAIAVGEVVKVNKIDCNSETSDSCNENGTMIKLKHNIMIDGTKYTFYSVYANLQAGSVSLKKGDKVKKGDVIGKAGKTGDTTISQVHFEFHNDKDTPIDPTNLFIECEAGELQGDSNEEKIWFYFRNMGYSEAATAGAMGNLQAESGLSSINLQNDYERSLGYTDQSYTDAVDNGKYKNFVNDSAGYGLAQWTDSSRKGKLYSYKKKSKTSIGDLQMQLEYLMTEVSGSGWSSKTQYNKWKNAKGKSGVNEAADAYCVSFERPASCNYTTRRENAQKIYERNKGKVAKSSSSVSSSSNLVISNAKKVKSYISSNGYTYGALGIEVKNWKKSKKIDCSSYVSAVLYEMNDSRFRSWLKKNGGTQATSYTFEDNPFGYKVISKKDIKPGDIIAYEGHVEIYAGMNGSQLRVYNAGSTNAIQSSGVTNSGHTLSQATKILRP